MDSALIYSESSVPPVLWIVFVILLLLSAFFSASETAYSSINIVRITNFAENGKKSAAKALKVHQKFDNTLSSILIGNNIVNIAMATIGAYIAAKMITDDTVSGIVSTAVVTLIVLIFGEIMPKSFAKKHAEGFALKTAYILSVLNILFFPLNFLFISLSKLITRGVKEETAPTVTEDELETIVDNMADEGVIEEDDSNLIINALKLSDKIIDDIMIPRVDMVAIDVDDTIENIKQIFFENQYSRIPVYKDDKDKILGILYERDFFTCLIEKKEFKIVDILKPVKYVNKKMPVDDFIRELQKEKVHMAIVSGKFGETAGLVTMEDALEELVGEIYDEHDDEEKEMCIKIDENEYLVDAKMDLNELFETLELGKAPSDHNKLVGWLYEQVDDMPKAGEQIIYNTTYIQKDDDEYIEKSKKLIFTIKEVLGRRITKVFLKIEDINENEN
ncbi:MAG: HlyC/CorC family transporter [Acholeplasmatales bacterium]|nr:HlyC/CorC family transporter [Acholeplasmatales bacterium]